MPTCIRQQRRGISHPEPANERWEFTLVDLVCQTYLEQRRTLGPIDTARVLAHLTLASSLVTRADGRAAFVAASNVEERKAARAKLEHAAEGLALGQLVLDDLHRLFPRAGASTKEGAVPKTVGRKLAPIDQRKQSR
jgi:hypothetical protein